VKELFMSLILRPIRIHVWGGLGSQLFAYALSLDLKSRFPSRRSTIVFHSSGVSRRLPELLEIANIDSFEVLDDYAHEELVDDQSKKSRKSWLRQSLKAFLKYVGVLATANDDSQFRKVKWWVISIRGHYSYRHIEQNFFLRLETLLSERKIKSAIDLQSALAVHYRLGDLVNLVEKCPDDPELVRREILHIYSRLTPIDCVVFSDSPDLAAQTLNIEKIVEPRSLELNAIDTLIVCAKCRYFIGSSSKLSYWAVALRCNVFKSPSSLPSQQKHLVHNLTRGSNLVSYFE